MSWFNISNKGVTNNPSKYFNEKMRKILIGFILILLLVGFYKLGEFYSPGSYPYVELYKFNSRESDLIAFIQKFKKERPEFTPPSKYHLKDGKKKESDHWYSIYLYYPNDEQIIHIWTRSTGRKSTDVGFVGINSGPNLGNWKLINKDYNSLENSQQKEKFKLLFINPLHKLIDNNQ